jgi:uncharacterized repeat protein (TIGR03803 family)
VKTTIVAQIVKFGLLAITLTLVTNAWSQYRETTLYNFAGAADGQNPTGDLTFDSPGNIYGATIGGGASTCGTIFKLTPSATGWTHRVLYSFNCTDGSAPAGGLVLDPKGNIYGTTESSGSNDGSIFELSRSSTGVWTQKVLYAFTGGPDGAGVIGGVVRDGQGNLYGIAVHGGANQQGTVFQLSPTASGVWAEKTIYTFTGGADGGAPHVGNLLLDSSGVLYGTASVGGNTSHPLCAALHGCGTVFSLKRSPAGSWFFKRLFMFSGENGAIPHESLIFGMDGKLYGTTQLGGAGRCSGISCGVVFSLSPTTAGAWTETVLYKFLNVDDGGNPLAGLTFDANGNLFGTTSIGGPSFGGTVFQLTPDSGGWAFSTIYALGLSNGPANPFGGLLVDAARNLYGTGTFGGASGAGAVFELSPENTDVH